VEASIPRYQPGTFLKMASHSPLSALGEPLDELCQGCHEMDLHKIMSINMHLPKQYQYGLLVAEVGDRFKTMPDNNCALCKMFFSSRLRPQDTSEARAEDEIRAFSFVDWFEGINTKKFMMPDSGVSLCVVPRSLGFGQPRERMATHFRENGHVFCYSPKSSQFSILSPNIVKRDFDAVLVKSWLEFCRAHHKSCATQSKRIAGLKLIDCETYKLVPASPEFQYVALSYVWGQVSAPQIPPGSSRIPACELPTSIADAIQVTISLGFRYLWVDQYCIDQEDAISKHEHISKMDMIYHDAELTIVAAAGDDQNYGLPGVNSRLRRVQRTLRFGNYTILDSMSDPHYDIHASRWFKRAWTFQEGLLSRRSLVFTDNQVYYECSGMNCFESIRHNVGSFHIPDKSEFESYMRKSLLGTNLDYINPHTSFMQVHSLLRQFTARNLTFDGDSLNAFLGVLRYFGRQECQVRHLWGVPVIIHEIMLKHYPREVDAYLLDSLCWRHVYSCWDEHESKPRRRGNFPSWSWAGWAGAIQYDRHPHEHQMSPFGSILSQLQLEYENGYLATFKEIFIGPNTDQNHRYPKALLIEAPVILPGVIELQSSSEEDSHNNHQWTAAGLPAFLNLSMGPSSTIEFLSALVRGVYHGILFGVDNRIGLRPNVNLFILILKIDLSGVANRCGMMTVKLPHIKDLQLLLDNSITQKFRLE
jgi:hypothetical protein